MNSNHPIIVASFFCPVIQAGGEVLPQQYDYSYQLYQEDDDRIRVESHYVRGEVDFDDATSLRFQWLNDAISGASPTGVLPGGSQPFLAELDDVRTGILGALSHQIGDHRVELEISRSKEDDYLSYGIALSDTLELNQKNTTLAYGFNYLNDSVTISPTDDQKKFGYDWFTGVTQVIDKNTVVSANVTIGYSYGYLNDPYKVIQRDEIVSIDLGGGDVFEFPVVNIYRENRPDSRLRGVLQLEGRHYFEPVRAALDGVFRFSQDDYGVFSQTVQLEWRQEVGENLYLIPFFRYYHQSAADFFANTLNDVDVITPAGNPDGSGPNYSADYRLSSLQSISGGVRLRYEFNDVLSASAAYERYVMQGTGSHSEHSPDQSYPSADIWTFGINAKF